MGILARSRRRFYSFAEPNLIRIDFGETAGSDGLPLVYRLTKITWPRSLKDSATTGQPKTLIREAGAVGPRLNKALCNEVLGKKRYSSPRK